jgi:protein-S-isoprenylcysteine O-methyltransferase Ste14
MDCPETARLRLYTSLKDPFLVVFNWKFIIAILSAVALYTLVFVGLPYIFLDAPACTTGEHIDRCSSLFAMDAIDHWRRSLFILMLTIFLRLWYVYFKSSFQTHETLPDGTPKPDYSYEYAVQSLRRFLILCAVQWQGNQSKDHLDESNKKSDRFFEVTPSDNPNNYVINEFVSPKNDDGAPLNEAFRRKASMSVEVAALFMVIVTLILDKSSDVITSYHGEALALDLWEILMLSLSSIFGIISFICFLISVDSLDTTFNKFVSKSTRHVALQYFYQVTSNPRYCAVVSMMMSMVFFFAFYSIFLGTLSLTALMYVGYRLWFPDINQALASSGFNINFNAITDNEQDIYVIKRRKISLSLFITILIVELLYLTTIGFCDAGIFFPNI